jgi:hypothetical protein
MSTRTILPLGLSALVLVVSIHLGAQETVEVDRKLASLKDGFETTIEREAAMPRREALSTLNKGYISALDRALTTATKAGNLEQAVVIRAEKDRVVRAEPIPENEDKKGVAVLKSLRESFSDSLSKLESDYLKRYRPVSDRYDQTLAALQKDLTRASKLNDALRVKAIRDQLALARVKGDLQLLHTSATTSGEQKSIYGITLISASYRVVDDPGRSSDVTGALQTALESDAESIVVVTRNLGKDPSSTKKKQLVVGYKYAGKAKEKTFLEGSTLIFKKDLN